MAYRSPAQNEDVRKPKKKKRWKKFKRGIVRMGEDWQDAEGGREKARAVKKGVAKSFRKLVRPNAPKNKKQRGGNKKRRNNDDNLFMGDIEGEISQISHSIDHLYGLIESDKSLRSYSYEDFDFLHEKIESLQEGLESLQDVLEIREDEIEN